MAWGIKEPNILYIQKPNKLFTDQLLHQPQNAAGLPLSGVKQYAGSEGCRCCGIQRSLLFFPPFHQDNGAFAFCLSRVETGVVHALSPIRCTRATLEYASFRQPTHDSPDSLPASWRRPVAARLSAPYATCLRYQVASGQGCVAHLDRWLNRKARYADPQRT